MADTTVDDSIQNLQHFCGVLADSNHRLESLSDALDSFASHMAEVEDTTEQQWNQLSEGLRAVIHTAESATNEVVTEVASLATAADDLAGSRLGSVAQELDNAEEGLTAHLRNAHESLAHRFDGVESNGYDAAKAKLDASVAEVDSAETDLDHHVTAATDALHTADGHLEAADGDLTHAIADANAAVEEAESHFDSAVQEAEAVDDTALAAASHEQGELDGLYGSFQHEIEDATQHLSDAITETGQEVGDALSHDIKDKLEADVDSQATQPAAKWDTELDGLDATLKDLETETKDLPKLVADLEISKRKVAELDEVLSAMV
jgi:chromosome segregation ATPase